MEFVDKFGTVIQAGTKVRVNTIGLTGEFVVGIDREGELNLDPNALLHERYRLKGFHPATLLVLSEPSQSSEN